MTKKVKRKRVNKKSSKMHKQLRRHADTTVPRKKRPKYEGNTETMVSTGSTLLDLAISAGRKHGGGIPGGVFIEISGPPSCGKTVLLCELAGAVQRAGGDVRFDDPEARLNKQFAELFDLDTDEVEHDKPDTVTKIFQNIRKWEPSNPDALNGTFTDSLAALSTDLEMDNDDGDKMGQRRAKEFSEGFRKNARIIAKANYIMAASNQIRDKKTRFGSTTTTPGGWALDFYASLRLAAIKVEPITKTIKINGKNVTKDIGARTTFKVTKSSIWKPYRTAPLTIIFDYGIDDIRDNLQYIKDYTKNTSYKVGDTKLGTSMEKAIRKVEKLKLEKELREEVIELKRTPRGGH
jgi:recombination protein RecA